MIPAVLQAGTRVGNYKIVRLLGRGGMAEVYEAEDQGLGRKVALKIVPADTLDDADTVARFEKEVRAVASLNHRGIVTVFEVGHTDSHHYFSMRLLSGSDLRARLRKGLEPQETMRILREVAAAFAHAHARGFVHRDVKPENILFDEQGYPVLTDFGIAKAMDSGTQLTKTGMVVGTPRYMSPEQAVAGSLDARSDLYSLGIILFEMLTGKPPYDAPEPMALLQKHLNSPIPRLPKEVSHLQPILDRLMAKDPIHRIGTAEELIVLIDAAKPRSTTSGVKIAHKTQQMVLATGKDMEARAEVARSVAEQLNKDPENQGLRFQLLRLYFDMERVEDFLKEARVFRYARSGLSPSQWEVVSAMGRKVAPLSPLFEDKSKHLQVEVIEFKAQDTGKAKRDQFQRIGEFPPKAKELFAELAKHYDDVRTQSRYFPGLELDLVRAGLRATPLVHAQRLSKRLGGARIFLKREDLGHGGHAMIAAAGQAYVADALGKKRIAAGIRDLRTGVLLGAAAARRGMQCDLWIDRDEYDRQSSAVFQLRKLGAKLHAVHLANYRNRDIREAALEEWLKHPDEVFWYLGLDAGPDPTGLIARDLTSIIGRETRRQLQSQTGQLPEMAITRGGNNPDPLGFFPAFLEDPAVSCIVVEPAGAEKGKDPSGDEYNPFDKSLDEAEMTRASAILGRMDYPSIKREIAWLNSYGRVQYRYTDVATALKMHEDMASLEGLLLSLDSAHAMAWAGQKARAMKPEETVVVLISDTGDKDLWEIERLDREQRGQAASDSGARPSGRMAEGRRLK